MTNQLPQEAMLDGLDPDHLRQIEEHAISMANEAGAMLLEHFLGPLDVEFKTGGDRDPVTIADKRTEEFIRGSILKAFPDHGIVAEEGDNQGKPDADFAWVVDPLDGTSNFLNHVPIWASSIGLLYRGIPVAAALYTPSIHGDGGRVIHGRLGAGAYLDGEKITVAPNARPDRGRLTTFPAFYWRMYKFRPPLLGRMGTIRSLGSTAYEMSAIATGTFQYGVFNPPSVWDIAAGILLAKEAGGLVMAKPSRRSEWEPLNAFPGTNGRPPTLKELQTWRAPVLAGNPAMARFIAEHTTQRARLIFRFRRYVQARRRSMRGNR